MRASEIQVSNNDVEAVDAYLYAHGWGDGLPIVPPTPESVAQCLALLGYEPETVIARLAPSMAAVTWEKMVINSMMAGCRPEHVLVVHAAIRAMADQRFNLGGVQATTGPHAPLCIVNGPIRLELGINGGNNCFGQGVKANAVIGRAIRLVLQNLGGGVPGRGDMATLGHPGKYSYCIGENEERSPWEPLAVARGVDVGANAVTVMACDAPHLIVDNTSTTSEGLLRTIAGTVRTIGSIQYYMSGRGMELGLVLCPEHAHELAAGGWSKAGIRKFLFEEARLAKSSLIGCGMYGNRTWPAWVEELPADGLVPIVADADRIQILVAGGAGRVSAWLPTWHTSKAVTEIIYAAASIESSR